MPQQEQASALLTPLSDIPQRVAQTQVQEALQFKGLQQCLYPETKQFRFTYAGSPTERQEFFATGPNRRYMMPWLVSRTLEIDQVGFFPDTSFTPPASTATTLTGLWRSHPTTFYPDGRPILEGMIGVPTTPANEYHTAVGEHVIEAGLYWAGFTSSVNFGMVAARFIPMGVNAMADTNFDLVNYSATNQPCGVLFNAGPLSAPDLDVSALTWASISSGPIITMRLRPT